MTTEIELKYLVVAEVTAEQISQVFRQKNIEFTFKEKQLTNSYFDTADLNLRKFDMGLRVRCDNGCNEQTIKTVGQVVGGLHSRPEYNIDIEGKFPILSMFPHEIWHPQQSVAELQNALISIFSTNFKRNIWLITDENDNQIELALDLGVIASGGKSESICEIEIELVTGSTEVLFDLAQILFDEFPMRPGIKSKAARGYALWRNITQEETNIPALFICDSRTDSIESAFNLGLNRGLTDLQQNTADYLASQSLIDLAKIKASLAVIRHGFWLFEAQLTTAELSIRNELSYFVHLLAWVDNAINLQELTNKTGNYRKKLDYSEQLIEQLKIAKRRFPNHDDISQLLHSSRFNQLQLDILKLYLMRAESATAGNVESRSELVQFARERIQFSLSEISDEMKSAVSFNCEQYIAQSKLLYRSLLTGTWLSGVFNHELRDRFRRPWLDLQQGISELQSLWIIQQQLEKLSQPPKKLVLWQRSKVDGLLTALDNTKAMATAMPPYWHEPL